MLSTTFSMARFQDPREWCIRTRPGHKWKTFFSNLFIFKFQMRIVILYAYNWHNKYFDQVVLVLTTLDPLINHCVCLWTMRKYRDGYASSLGKVFSCFKPSEEGMFRSAITRISSISRRSFSRSSSSARSSSMRTSRRKSCKFGVALF